MTNAQCQVKAAQITALAIEAGEGVTRDLLELMAATWLSLGREQAAMAAIEQSLISRST